MDDEGDVITMLGFEIGALGGRIWEGTGATPDRAVEVSVRIRWYGVLIEEVGVGPTADAAVASARAKLRGRGIPV